MNIKIASRLLSALLFSLIFEVLQYCKIVLPLVGLMRWSPLFLAAPIMGGFFGPSIGFSLVLIKRLIKISLRTSLLPLTYHIPTLFASAYWAYSRAFIRLYIPIICMILFIIHPIGGQAWAYSLYWLIPVFLYFVKHDSIVLTALGATFIQHAIGSLCWLYCTSMSPEQWLALIPLVFVERVVAVLLMSIGAFAAQVIEKRMKVWLARTSYAERML